MAKMFYTLEEAAAKLGKSEDEVKGLAESGQLQEFRDRDRLMFKVDQVDLLAADEGHDAADMSSMIPLAGDEVGGGLSLEESQAPPAGAPETGVGEDFDFSEEPLLEDSGGLTADSGSALAMEDTGAAPGGSGVSDASGKSGVSIFDADDLEEADPSAVTQLSDGDDGLGDFSLEGVGGSGSGSGLMDLAREADDTSLGANAFLEEIGGAEDSLGGAPAPTSTDLFEGSEVEADGASMAPAGAAMVAAEAYDGSGSGLVGGLALGMVIALAVALMAMITGFMGVTDAGLGAILADQFLIVMGSVAGLTLIAGVLGMVLGGRRA